mgnify:CR=1 FL=1
MNNKIINTNIRFNLTKADDRRAWEYLQSMDRSKHKSYSRAVISAINEYFEREQKLADNPFLETQEKEDRFMQKILDTINQGLQKYSASGGLASLIKLISANQEPPIQNSQNTDEDNAVALDFADSF